MSSLSVPPLADEVRAAGERLELWLRNLHQSLARATPLPPDKMSGLLAELRRAGQLLRSIPNDERDPVLSSTLSAYHQKLESLREFLPVIQRQLLLEKSRLEAKRNHLEAAAEWARSSRQTLARR